MLYMHVINNKYINNNYVTLTFVSVVSIKHDSHIISKCNKTYMYTAILYEDYMGN